MTDLLVQLLLSLIGVIFVGLAAGWLGLGGDLRIRDEATARRLAAEAIDGFEAVDICIDRAGIGAVLRDREDRVLLLRRHGVHFVARLLDSHSGARLDRNFLTITTGDRHFGTVTLNLGPQAQVWAGSFRRLGG